MKQEIFDVVDANDCVIDRQPRGEVHRRGLRHRAVHVLVFNARGQLFLQKRSLAKDCFPGTWDSSASGHLDSGEDYEGAALRELEEELGWKAEAALEPLFKTNACADTGQEFTWTYRHFAEGPFVLHPEEIERGDWFSPEVITAWIELRPDDFAPAFRLIWASYQRECTRPRA